MSTDSFEQAPEQALRIEVAKRHGWDDGRPQISSWTEVQIDAMVSDALDENGYSVETP